MKFKQIALPLMMGGIILATGTTNAATSAFTDKYYANTSVLSTGTWVKVGVEETGVYSITYDALREMGFSNPSKVSVYGRGGRVLSESFVSSSGLPVFYDDLSSVKVIHENDCLYFYGLGTEEITFQASNDYDTGGYFNRVSNNIYSKRGYYFLTDSKPVDNMSTVNNTSGSTVVDTGVSYIYHEKDLYHNSTRSGQLFWGEPIGAPAAPQMTWEVSMPDGLKGKGVMQCEIYIQHNDGIGNNASIGYGFLNTTGSFRTPYSPSDALYYSPHNPTVAQIDVPGNTGTAFVEYVGNKEIGEYANLDYWVISYERAIPTMKDAKGNSLNQQLIALPKIGKGGAGKFELANPASLVVLDVSTPGTPQRLKITQKGETGTVGVSSVNKIPVVVVFDKDKPQLQISGYDKAYVKIENQNLHDYKDKGTDYIIVTTREFKPYAEELAQLHRDYDGMDVIVATTEELYNEFSGGTPDPMAYRSFAKMLYFSEKKPKVMLLLGPLYGDYRGLQSEHDPAEGIIAYQSPSISVTRGAHNINDFYGMMSDKFRTDYYERNDVEIGVAILPVRFGNEARIVIDKVREYLKRTDHAYYLNRFSGIGGLLDEHTHEIQVRDIEGHISTLTDGSIIFTPIPIDTYGNAEARKKFMNQLNDGCSMFSYFGHGAEMFLGKDRKFFNAGDVYSLRNKKLPLALFGGCELTNSDRGLRGLGETIVTNTTYGAIGAVVSARETWSGQNFEFFKQWFTCLYKEGSTVTSASRQNPVMIGQVYAGVKNYSTYSNELAYQLICDPALYIPIPTRGIKAVAVKPDDEPTELHPGESLKMKGTITLRNNQKDNDFNGELVVRLTEPNRSVKAGNIETGQDTKDLVFKIADQQISMGVAKVTNGEFELDVHVPASAADFSGEDVNLYFSAYDPSTKQGASAYYYVTVGVVKGETTESKDNVAPVIEEFSFNELEQTFKFTVSDNVALNLSSSPLNKGLYLFVDGKERSEVHFAEPSIETGRAAYSKDVYVGGITLGDHTARLRVKDAAGNSTEQEITFRNIPGGTSYSIVKVEGTSAESTTVEIEGNVPASAQLVVLSPEGNEVWRGTFNGSRIEWNHESDGMKVPAGHYKAYLIETGEGVMKGHSEPIDIPVI